MPNFDSIYSDSASPGGVTFGVNVFTDTDSVVKAVPFSQIAFGGIGSIPTIVDGTHGLPVTVTNASLAVTGTFFQATQPVSGSGTFTTALTASQLATLTPLTTVAVTQSTSPWVVNTTQLGGVAIALGSGVTNTGTQRVVIASDDTINASLGSSTLNVAIVSGGGSGGTASNFGSAFPTPGTAAGFKSSSGSLMQPGNLDVSGNLLVNVAAGGASGGTSSSYGSAFPATGTAAGFETAGGNMSPGLVDTNRYLYVDLGAIGGTTLGSSTLSVSLGASTPTVTVANASLAVTGTFFQATQPVSGTVTANAGTGNFTVVQSTASALNATVVGTGTFLVQAAQSGTWNVGTVTTVTTVSAVTAITNPLPAGTNTLGSVSLAGTYTPFKFLPSSGTNTFTVKASAGVLTLLDMSNASSSPAFVHIYNLGTPTIGGGSASMPFFIPSGGGHVVPIIAPGITFNAGIGITVTGGSMLDNDTIAINGAGSISVTGAFA